jgi:general transcription factor 3C polypeptide 3 (transcription factor C subunit 4)
VIRNDPEIHTAWTSLASCYEELEKHDLARQVRMIAAHVDVDEHKWKNLAREFK